MIAAQTDALFKEARVQLGEVLSTTLQATENIMDIAERHLDGQARAAALLHSLYTSHNAPDALSTEHLDSVIAWHQSLGEDLTHLVTMLSFQDITGQRIKKVLETLDKIEEAVGEHGLASGIIPHNANTAVQPSQAAGSILKGPTSDASQERIDVLLTQLGKN